MSALIAVRTISALIVVSDIPANLEVGLPAEDYFPVGDVDALAERLRAVMSQPFGHVEYDMRKYDWERIADEVGEVYN